MDDVVDRLIRQKSGYPGDTMSEEGVAALEKIIDFNDDASALRRRVSCDAVVKMLRQEFGWKGKSRRHLDKFCKDNLDRYSFGSMSAPIAETTHSTSESDHSSHHSEPDGQSSASPESPGEEEPALDSRTSQALPESPHWSEGP